MVEVEELRGEEHFCCINNVHVLVTIGEQVVFMVRRSSAKEEEEERDVPRQTLGKVVGSQVGTPDETTNIGVRVQGYNSSPDAMQAQEISLLVLESTWLGLACRCSAFLTEFTFMSMCS